MDNIIAFGLDVSSNQMKQINTINNTILAYNMVGGTYNTYIPGAVGAVGNYNAGANNSFTVPIAGRYVLNICASAYSTTTPNLQINIWINDTNTNYSLKKYTNEYSSRKTLVPISFKYNLNQGTNTIALKVATGTLAVGTDYASFSWMYAPS